MPANRAADFYRWLQANPGRTHSEITTRYGLTGRYDLDNLFISCEAAGLLLWEGELVNEHSGPPPLALFAMEGR